MIYKNNVTVKKIEQIIDVNSITCHFHLSNDKVWTYRARKIKPEIMHNQTKLENYTIMTLARGFQELKEEMNK